VVRCAGWGMEPEGEVGRARRTGCQAV